MPLRQGVLASDNCMINVPCFKDCTEDTEFTGPFEAMSDKDSGTREGMLEAMLAWYMQQFVELRTL